MLPDIKQSLRDAVENKMPDSIAEHREFFQSLADQLNAIGLRAYTDTCDAGLLCKSDQSRARFRIYIGHAHLAYYDAIHSNGYPSEKKFDLLFAREKSRNEIIQTIGYWIANNASQKVIQKLLPDRKPITAPPLKLDI